MRFKNNGSNKGGFIDHTALVIIVVGVAILGSFYLVATHAATKTAVIFSNYQTAVDHSSSTTVTSSSVSTLDSNQNVVSLSENQKADFTPLKGGGGWYDISTCYFLAAPDGNVTALIGNESATLQVHVAQSLSYYAKYCLNAPSSSGSYTNDTVENLSSTPLYIYQAELNSACKTMC